MHVNNRTQAVLAVQQLRIDSSVLLEGGSGGDAATQDAVDQRT